MGLAFKTKTHTCQQPMKKLEMQCLCLRVSFYIPYSDAIGCDYFSITTCSLSRILQKLPLKKKLLALVEQAYAHLSTADQGWVKLWSTLCVRTTQHEAHLMLFLSCISAVHSSMDLILPLSCAASLLPFLSFERRQKAAKCRLRDVKCLLQKRKGA